MTPKSTVFLMIAVNLFVVLPVMAQTETDNLSKADALYEAGKKQDAKTFYRKAAGQGSADAHFALAYKYILDREKKVFHYTEAAQKGHAEALGYALELLLFRSSSLTETDPKRALKLYQMAKEANPNLEIYDEKEKVEVMKMSVVTADFNGKAFIEKYHIDSVDLSKIYSIWQLAEKASRPDGKFGKPDPKLILALVVRGSDVPAEKMAAIKAVYKNYQQGIVKPFDICDYITSGNGMGFCASRANAEDAQHRQAKLDSLKRSVSESAAPLIEKAYTKAEAFIEAKALLEEAHGGSGRVAWITFSQMKQKHQFLDLIDSVQNGFEPQLLRSFKTVDRTLNQTYQKALAVLGDDEHPFQYFTEPEDLRKVQGLWISFRDATAAAFQAINPDASLDIWKAWLTEKREGQLRQIPGMQD